LNLSVNINWINNKMSSSVQELAVDQANPEQQEVTNQGTFDRAFPPFSESN
jgi:hypothetical protein